MFRHPESVQLVISRSRHTCSFSAWYSVLTFHEPTLILYFRVRRSAIEMSAPRRVWLPPSCSQFPERHSPSHRWRVFPQYRRVFPRSAPRVISAHNLILTHKHPDFRALGLGAPGAHRLTFRWALMQFLHSLKCKLFVI